MRNEEKYRRNMNCLDRWMTNLENKKNSAVYLASQGIRSVGIYGYGLLGRHLVKELSAGGMKISWIMDRSAGADEVCAAMIRPQQASEAPVVDLVVITSIAALEEAEYLLLEAGIPLEKIISIEEIVDLVFSWRNV